MKTKLRYFLGVGISLLILCLFIIATYLLFIDYPVRFKNESNSKAVFRVIQGRGISKSQLVRSGDSFIYVPTSGYSFSLTVIKLNGAGDVCDGKLESHKDSDKKTTLAKSRLALACYEENKSLCSSSINILSKFLGMDVIFKGEKIWLKRWLD